jgi:hypothetical protein
MLDDVSGQGHKSQRGTWQHASLCFIDQSSSVMPREKSLSLGRDAAPSAFSRLLSGLNPPSPRRCEARISSWAVPLVGARVTARTRVPMLGASS